MRFVLFFAFLFVLSVVTVLAAPKPAHAFFDFLFPAPSTEPDPSETLRAPFASEDDVIFDMDSGGNELAITPLDERHRTNRVITNWLQEFLPTLLTFSSENYQRSIREALINFTAVGGEEYRTFLEQTNIIKTLQTGRYSVTGVINDFPVVMNEGAIDGRYRWLYQTGVMITFYDQNIETARPNSEREAITLEYTLTFQVGRYRESPNEHGLYIESWGFKQER